MSDETPPAKFAIDQPVIGMGFMPLVVKAAIWRADRREWYYKCIQRDVKEPTMLILPESLLAGIDEA